MDEIIFLRRRSFGAAAVVILFAIVLLPLVPLLAGVADPQWGARVLGALTEDPVGLAAFVFGGLAMLVWLPLQLRYEKAARLLVDRHGIRFQSGLSGRLGGYLERGWPIAWSDIDSVVLHPGPKKNLMELVLRGRDGRRRRIRPEAWRARSEPERSVPVRLRGLNRDDLQAALSAQPLLRQFGAAGVAVEIAMKPPGADLPGSDLAKVPQAVVALGLLGALGTYGLVDGFVIAAYAYVGPLPWGSFSRPAPRRRRRPCSCYGAAPSTGSRRWRSRRWSALPGGWPAIRPHCGSTRSVTPRAPGNRPTGSGRT